MDGCLVSDGSMPILKRFPIGGKYFLGSIWRFAEVSMTNPGNRLLPEGGPTRPGWPDPFGGAGTETRKSFREQTGCATIRHLPPFVSMVVNLPGESNYARGWSEAVMPGGAGRGARGVRADGESAQRSRPAVGGIRSAEPASDRELPAGIFARGAGQYVLAPVGMRFGG